MEQAVGGSEEAKANLRNWRWVLGVGGTIRKGGKGMLWDLKLKSLAW